MEGAIRFGVFLAVFAAVAVVEWRLPKRVPALGRADRWRVNLSILALDVLAQRLTLGAAAYATAIVVTAHGLGLFPLLAVPAPIAAVAGFLLLDLAVYLQHVASHRYGVFWRLHEVHHADLEVDLTTGIRFHPLEILLSLLWKCAVVALLGVGPWTVVAFEAVLNASALFTHANLRLPVRVDRALRLLVCTPDMHRIHHSARPEETHSNFGFFLSLWDRAFGTFRRDPDGGHDGMTLGLPLRRDPARLGLSHLLAMPFRPRPTSAADRPPPA